MPALWRGGDTISYHGSLMVLPEHNMAAAVVMSGGSSLYGYAMRQSLLLQVLLADGMIPEIIPPQEIPPPIASEMPSELTEYAGLYGNNSMLGRIAISPGGELTLTPLAGLPEMGADRPSETYFYTLSGEFVSEQGDKRLTFVEESNGKTYTLLVRTNTLPGVGQVVVTGYDMERIEPKPVDEAVPGYVDRHRIVDANSAVQDFQIPVMAGRGSVDLEISVIDGKEYLSAADMVYLSEKTWKSCRLARTSRMPIDPARRGRVRRLR